MALYSVRFRDVIFRTIQRFPLSPRLSSFSSHPKNWFSCRGTRHFRPEPLSISRPPAYPVKLKMHSPHLPNSHTTNHVLSDTSGCKKQSITTSEEPSALPQDPAFSFSSLGPCIRHPCTIRPFFKPSCLQLTLEHPKKRIPTHPR